MLTPEHTENQDTKRFVQTLFAIGIGFAIMIAVFVTEYTLILAEMSLIQEKLDLSIEQMVGDGSIPAYILAMVFWTVLLGGVVGWIWGNILVPGLDRTEKFMLGLSLGVFVMPMSFVIPALIVSVRKLHSDWFGSTLPDYYGMTIDNVVSLFAGTQEQVYELTNILILVTLGIVVLLVRFIFHKPRSGNNQISSVPGRM